MKIICTYLILFSSIAFSQYEHGTCIIVYLTKDTVFVGADNRTFIQDSGTHYYSVGTKCKIFRVDSTYFAFAGASRLMMSDSNSFSKYIAEKAISDANDLWNASRLFSMIYSDLLSGDTSYAMMLRDKPFQILFFGIHNSKAIISSLSFGDPNIFLQQNLDLISRIDYTVTQYPFYSVIGVSDSIKPFLESNKDYFLRLGKIQAIKNLIELEHIKNPSDVNSNPNILYITFEGPTWIQRNVECKTF